MHFLIPFFGQVLAEVFQDLLANKDDYLRALRGLLRETVRNTRQDIDFAIFCRGLTKERQEAKFTDVEPALKVCLSVFILISLFTGVFFSCFCGCVLGNGCCGWKRLNCGCGLNWM